MTRTTYNRPRLMISMAVLMLTAACARDDEAAMRARLVQWFSVGETLAFKSSIGCATGLFRLTDFQIKSAMPKVGDVPQMLIMLKMRGVAALDNKNQPPDQALVDLANAERATGMRMRRVALEARDCMAGHTESAFSYALVNPKGVLAYDRENQALMLLDPKTGVLVVVMGSGE